MNPEPLILAVVSTWESVALITGRVPTVTSLVMRLPRLIRSVLVVGVTGWMVAHFEVRRPHGQ